MTVTRNNRDIYLGCLKYAPGMWQHMHSFASQLLQRGYTVRFLLSSGFQWMHRSYEDVTHYVFYSTNVTSMFKDIVKFLPYKWSLIKNILRQHQPSALLLVSWHPLNFLLCFMVKLLSPGTPIILWLHEPYKDDKRIYGSKSLIIYLVELCQTLSLFYVDVAILHSKRGLRLFEYRYPKFKGARYLIPLGFQDEGDSDNIKRRYISFLGKADRAKGIELFFEMVEKLSQQELDYEFQIVTSSDIQSYLQVLSPAARRKLQVINRPRISDADLRTGAANSLAVLTLYKETMQSGVIPLALMKGTPVIGTDIEGITEWIRHKETGIIISTNPTLEEIQEGIAFIKSDFAEMTRKCRAYYLETFDDRNWDRYYSWIPGLVQGK